MDQNNSVTSADIAARVLTFCLLLIGGVVVLATQTETHDEPRVTECAVQIDTQEPKE